MVKLVPGALPYGNMTKAPRVEDNSGSLLNSFQTDVLLAWAGSGKSAVSLWYSPDTDFGSNWKFNYASARVSNLTGG